MIAPVRLVMTLLIRDEADIVRENLDFHFAQGVDFVVATDNRSRDGTRELLAEYEEDGRVRVIDEPGVYAQGPWQTRAMREAVDREGADWVFPNDADEFWLPRTGTLKELLESQPDEVGALTCPRVTMAPTPEDGRLWWERMNLRQKVSVNRGGTRLRPKLVHRAYPDIYLPHGGGNHGRPNDAPGTTRESRELEILHFPTRTYVQFEAATVLRGLTLRKGERKFNVNRRREYQLWRKGQLREYYRELERSQPDDQIVEDNLFRDHLRALYAGRPPAPTRPPSLGLRSRAVATTAALPLRARARLTGAADVKPHQRAPFVVGVPRSGTTLIRLMLDSHPDLAIPAETHFIPRAVHLWQKLERAGVARDARVERCLDFITSHPRWAPLDIEADALRSYVRGLRRPSAADMARAVHVVHARSRGKSRWGDKTPSYLIRMKQLDAVLPEARFVHVIRDGRDVALSLATVSWGPEDAREAAKMWRQRIQRARRQAVRLRPGSYMELRYEDLVEEPEPALRRIAAFAGLEWDEAMLAHHEQGSERMEAEAKEIVRPDGTVLAAEERRRTHRMASEPLRSDRVGRWRSGMSATDVEAFERVAGPLLIELGYPLAKG